MSARRIGIGDICSPDLGRAAGLLSA